VQVASYAFQCFSSSIFKDKSEIFQEAN